MDKKGLRTVQTLSKGSATENKKGQDVANKPWPRGGRRREPQGGSFPAKCDAPRKPTPQRNRNLDKRPRPRGTYYSSYVEEKEEAPVGDEQVAEFGSVFVQGSKKQSLNHLLNFHFEPRDVQASSRNAHTKNGYRWNTKHKYNKEQFLQANCQFVVKAQGDYSSCINNPDTLVDWDSIEQVNIHVFEFPSCPICLYPPVAAKMTRCGHIYCWSCLLHYISLSDKTHRKCPICYEDIHQKELKSVVAVPHPSLNINETMTFNLMKRLKGSLTAYPISQPIRGDDTLVSMLEKNSNAAYCKLLIADKSEVTTIIDRERKELEFHIAQEEDEAEKCFFEQAMVLLIEREQRNFDLPEKVPIQELDLLKEERRRYESVSSETASSVDGAVSDNQECLNNPNQSGKFFYFYQAADGQHVYLHSLNIRMLEHMYGSLEFCPKTITGRILEKEPGSITEELRRRLRYLQHLPVTCPFEVAEIQLKPPIINRETLNFFQDQIEFRRKSRQKRMREEKRRERRINEEENRKMGKFPAAELQFESRHQFPDVGIDVLDSPALDVEISDNTEGDLAGSPKKEEQTTALSFAKMLSTKKPVVDKFPALKSDSSRFVNITGTQSKFVPLRTRNQSDSEPEPDGYVPAPSFNDSFGDAIALALEKAALSNQQHEEDDSKATGKKKKKKNKQKILFATNMSFNSGH